MYLSEIKIEGYKIFDERITITFNKGLNLIVGENGSGKSTIIDAIRLLLLIKRQNSTIRKNFYKRKIY